MILSAPPHAHTHHDGGTDNDNSHFVADDYNDTNADGNDNDNTAR